MYSLQVKSTFIEFRSMGFTIDDISEKTGVHRTTLLQWNKELYADIKIAEQNQLDRILMEVGADRIRRVEMLGMQLAFCYDMLTIGPEAKHDYMKLLTITEKLTRLLHKELAGSKPPVRSGSKSDAEEIPIIVSNPDLYKAFDPDYNPRDYPTIKQDNQKIKQAWFTQLKDEKRNITEEDFDNEDLQNENPTNENAANENLNKEKINKTDSENLKAAPSRNKFNNQAERKEHSIKNERSKNENRERSIIKEQAET